MNTRGIRGATTVSENTKQAIINETKALILEMLTLNDIDKENIVSIFFSVTQDLDAVFPAAAARELDLIHTPLLCLNEINVPNSLKKCIRVLIHANSPLKQSEIKHVYLNEATSLRPEFAR